MPQNYVNARLRIAANAAAGVQSFVSGLKTLEEAQDDLQALATLDPANGSGTFLDPDFSQIGGLAHLSAALMTQLLGPVLATLQGARDSHMVAADPTSPTLGQVLRSCQRGLG